MKSWYAVHTYSGHENKVKTNIERRAESLGLKDKISRILVPVEEETRTRSGRRQQIKRKVFPGYLLIGRFAQQQKLFGFPSPDRPEEPANLLPFPHRRPAVLEVADREAIRCGGLRGLAQTLDCRKNVRLDQSQSPLGS